MFSRFGLKREPLRKREEPTMGENRASKPSLPTVMLVLKQPFSIDKERFFNALCSRYKKADGTEPLVTVMDDLVTFAGVVVAILSRSQPLPDDWQELAAPGRNLHWPTALDVCAHHRAHLIFSVMGEQSDGLRGIRVLTAIAGAFAALYPDQVLAGLWGSKVLNSREAWVKVSATSFAAYPNLPISLWVSQHPFSDETTGGLGVLTQGLARFVGRELEFVAPGSDLKLLLDRAFGMTAYLVQHGPVLKDGSTFGISETERVAVTLRVSSRFSGLPVIAATLA